MAKPQIVQMLSHGKALCRKAFSGFVDTFNYAVRRIDNLSGDGDGENAQGKIKVDNSDPEHPVIRLDEEGLNVKCAENSGLKSEGKTIDLEGRGDDKMSVRDLTYKDENGEDVEVKVLASEDIEIPEGVRSVNGETGKITVAGGNKIKVETSGKTITISFDEGDQPGPGPGPGPDDPDNPPGDDDGPHDNPDPCADHPGSDGDGGVGAGGDGTGDVDDDGGVKAGGEDEDGVGCEGCK